MAARIGPEAPVTTSTPAAVRVWKAFGPQLPVRTVFAPFEATSWAAWIPAPPEAATKGFSTASDSIVSVSTIKK
jgi:hypothetical protein